MLESPKEKRDKETIAAVLRSPQAWFGFLYGVTLMVISAIAQGNTTFFDLMGNVVLGFLAGGVSAFAAMQVRDHATLRACIIGGLLASLRTGVIILFASSWSWADIATHLLFDGLWGARAGYSYRQSPRKMAGSAIIGGIVLGIVFLLLTLSTEPTEWLNILFQSETIKNTLMGVIYGAYGGSSFGFILTDLETYHKRKQLEFSHPAPSLPSAGALSFGIIPMATAMVTYKGAGVVRFGNLELQVNRTQYQDLKLGLTYKIEYHEEDQRLLGYELVSKETAVIGERL